MRIYDAHMHIGGSSAPNPKELLRRLNACGISGGNVISIDPDDGNFTYRERVRNLFQWVEGYEDRLFPIAWIHPDEDNVLDKVHELDRLGVAGFKFIANTYSVKDEKAQRVFREIEELNKPIIFHSGILYDFIESSQYNKPLDWECFTAFKNLHFSMGHCGHPWYDECLLVFGKFNWMRYHTQAAAEGKPTIYYNNPWVMAHKDGTSYAVPELFLDTTPGAHKVYRRDLLTKLASYYPDGRNIFFGTDKYVEDYPAEIVKGWLAFEKEILDAAGASEEFRENMYFKSMFRFLRKELPQE